MKNLLIVSIFLSTLLTPSLVLSQTAPDFTITDTNGDVHNLHADYLDKGITVALKFFFVNCPPCNAIAPSMQELYEKWGEGQYDVQFIELSIISGDSNEDVSEYKKRHNLTFPGAGMDGGALEAVTPYISGQFGTFFGTPSFAVIKPDKSVVYNTGGAGNAGKIEKLDQAIEDTGATGSPSNNIPSSNFVIALEDPFGQTISDVQITLTDATNPSNSYPITGNTLEINTLSEDFPGITDPVLKFSKVGSTAEKISPLDLLLMRKHILSLIPITDPEMVIAGDTNADGAITPLDLLLMRKLILNIITEFPIPNYKFIPEELPLTIINGQTQELKVKIIKIGDLNGF